MKRRQFLGLVGGAAASWPLSAPAQQIPSIGILGTGSAAEWAHLVEALRRGLKEIGYVEGQNVTIQYRWADNQPARLPSLTSELVEGRVAVIAVAGGTASALAAKAATKSIPIVFALGGDPIVSGLVASMNQPNGNLTGSTCMTTALDGKRVELLHELVPTAKLIAVLIDPSSPLAETHRREATAAVRAIGRDAFLVEASREQQLEAAFASMIQQSAKALLVSPGPFFTSHRARVVALAARYAIPASYSVREFSEAGGLMSYGSSMADSHRQAGVYVGRILKGAKPSDLPVLQPTKFELVINLKTAKALGLEVPLFMQQRADEVIE